MNIPFNDDWLFTFDYERGFDAAEKVRLPHTVKELPYNYVDCKDYQTVCGYQKSFFVPDDWSDKLLSLRFDGAAHSAVFSASVVSACPHTEFSSSVLLRETYPQ